MKKVLQQGDIIRIAFDPSLGQEQQGVRPALVVSVQPVNALSNRVIVAAISNGAGFNRKYGLVVPLIGTGLQTTGVIICDQLRTMTSEQGKLLSLRPLLSMLLMKFWASLQPFSE